MRRCRRRTTALEAERLLLQIAAGAASERLYVSYPRIELSESRARVPSFYALDVMRAATGPRARSRRARGARARGRRRDAGLAGAAASGGCDRRSGARPRRPAAAARRERSARRSKATRITCSKLNECLRRSVVDRWARGERRWSPNDGLTRVSPYTAAALAAQRLTRALVLAVGAAAVQRVPLSVRAVGDLPAAAARAAGAAAAHGSADARQPLSRDPGAVLSRRCSDAASCRSPRPIARRRARVLDDVIERGRCARARRAGAGRRARLEDEVAAIRRDLHAWLEYLARDGAEWVPKYFEFAFGPVPGERDAHSMREDVGRSTADSSCAARSI